MRARAATRRFRHEAPKLRDGERWPSLPCQVRKCASRSDTVVSRSQFEHPLVMVEPTDHGLQVCIRSPVCDQDIPFPAAAMAQANPYPNGDQRPHKLPNDHTDQVRYRGEASLPCYR
jgi:hypothetical protein